MVKVPRIEKFRGDYEQSWDKWILRFEAECKALEIDTAENKKRWRDILTVCTDGDAFTNITTDIEGDINITYATIKRNIKTKYSGDAYKRHLTAKLRNHKFRAGLSIPTYLHELRSLIKEAYDVTNTDAVDQIGMSHILTNLEESLKKEVHILQLAGNTRLENLLELVASKMSAPFSAAA